MEEAKAYAFGNRKRSRNGNNHRGTSIYSDFECRGAGAAASSAFFMGSDAPEPAASALRLFSNAAFANIAPSRCLWMVVRIRAKMAQRKKLAWPLRSSQPLLAVERLVANDGWVTSRVKAVSRRRRGPQARLYRACHPAILDHRGRRLTPATLLPPPSMRGFTPPVTDVHTPSDKRLPKPSSSSNIGSGSRRGPPQRAGTLDAFAATP